jgi:hypothetical protein
MDPFLEIFQGIGLLELTNGYLVAGLRHAPHDLRSGQQCRKINCAADLRATKLGGGAHHF